MTMLISHRGNLTGPDPSRENSPQYIMEAIKKDYMVEVDLRSYQDKLYLGHDEPQYQIDMVFLVENRSFLWVHCKDSESMHTMLKYTNMNCFWHYADDYTMTSMGYVWAYPGKRSVGNLCVMVMPELHWSLEEISKFDTFGICSDYVEQIKNYK